ncbi:hypothetical protein L6452_26210 [Arctium lappa]|uniref:Uncharacterized protein n=1 Tax=Arctium lappa TaxID=4217 RepID=A0ACB9AC48_ARCLA|nr:hypothetical protein L6452_26210 [Arctium lappa]
MTSDYDIVIVAWKSRQVCTESGLRGVTMTSEYDIVIVAEACRERAPVSELGIGMATMPDDYDSVIVAPGNVAAKIRTSGRFGDNYQ